MEAASVTLIPENVLVDTADYEGVILCRTSSARIRSILDKAVKICNRRADFMRDMEKAEAAAPERYAMQVMRVGICLAVAIGCAAIGVELMILRGMGSWEIGYNSQYLFFLPAIILGIVWIVKYVKIVRLKAYIKNSEKCAREAWEGLTQLELDNGGLLSCVPLAYQDSPVLRSLMLDLNAPGEGSLTEATIICDDKMHQTAIEELKRAQSDQVKRRMKLNQKSVLMHGVNTIQTVRLFGLQNDLLVKAQQQSRRVHR